MTSVWLCQVQTAFGPHGAIEEQLGRRPVRGISVFAFSRGLFACLSVAFFTSWQHAKCISGTGVPRQFQNCHTDTEAADHTWYRTSCIDTGLTGFDSDPETSSVWRDSRSRGRLEAAHMTGPGTAGSHPRFAHTRGGGLSTMRSRLSLKTSWSLLVGCFSSQQHNRVSHGRICADNFYVLPHQDRSYRSNLPSHPVTVY